MGFLDKAKEAADKAMVMAQQAAEQGQDKLEEVKQQRAQAALEKALGEAYYAEQRRGGSHDAVTAALEALDAHHASVVVEGTVVDDETPGTTTNL